MSRAKAAAVYREGGVERHAEGDFVLCTIPYSVLSRVEVQPEFSAVKWRAIRELNYDSSTKVLAVAAKRFWETDDGIYGGGTFTDLPTVSTYYPSDNADAKNPMASRGPGVMLASYSWGQPARRLASMPHRERAAEVLRHLARIHPQLKTPGIVRHTASWSWDIIRGRAVRSRCSCRASTANCRRPPSRPRVASISLASTLRSCIRGCRARSNSGLRATREMLESAQRA